MAQVFEENGTMIPVTYILCEPNIVHQIKEEEKDGVNAIVLGADTLKKEKKTKKYKILREFSASKEELKKGDTIKTDIFENGEAVTIVSTSKGKGFAGQVRRHNFRVARKTHGTKEARHGSTGACAMPGRSKPGIKMAGRMGNNRVTLRNRTIVNVDTNKNIIAVKGPVPGAKNAYVLLKKQA